MALNMFIKIDSIKGESQDDKHKDEIDVLSWSWGLEQTAETLSGGGGGAGKVSVHDLAITKRTDIATPQLMLACTNGKRIKEALLTVGRPDRLCNLTLADGSDCLKRPPSYRKWLPCVIKYLEQGFA